MRKTLLIPFLFLVLMTACLGYFRRSLYELFTNTSCGPCVPANNWLDVWYPLHIDEVCVVRYHTNWPGASDPFYVANTTQNQQRWSNYGVTYVPWAVVNGHSIGTWTGTGDSALSVAGEYTFLEIDMIVVDSGICRVTVNCEESSYDGVLKLICILIEDSIRFSAPNGQTIFFETMRYMLPAWNGENITISGISSIVREYNFRPYLSTVSKYRNCWYVAILQDFTMPRKDVLQCNKVSASFMREYYHVVTADRTRDLVQPSDTSVFNITLSNYGTRSDQFDVWFREDFPSGWFIDLRSTGAPFDSTRIALDAMASRSFRLKISPMGAIDGGRLYLYVRPVADPHARTDTLIFAVYSGGELLLIKSRAVQPTDNRYETLLTNNWIDYMVWSLATDGDLPDISRIPFSAIIWQDGKNTDYAMSITVRTGIQNYLANGGKLLISSAGLGRTTPIYAFYTAVLGASYTGLITNATSILGNTGTLFTGFSGAYNGDTAEAITARAPAVAVTRFNVGPTSGLTKDFDGGGKLVYFSFMLESITDPAKQNELFNYVLDYWGILDVPENKPASFELMDIRPNPFNSSLSIEISLPKSSHLKLEVFDISGKLVETLRDGIYPAGDINVKWSPRDEPSGIYFIRMSAGDIAMEKKALLIK